MNMSETVKHVLKYKNLYYILMKTFNDLKPLKYNKQNYNVLRLNHIH